MRRLPVISPARETMARSWKRIPRASQRLVVSQLHEDGCGPACGEMLLADRGWEIDQKTIAEGMELPMDGPRLAQRLRDLSALEWIGGAWYLPDGPVREIVATHCNRYGTWAALLEPNGPRRVGHWVVVDGLSEQEGVWVRDPVGQAYGIPVAEFLSLWQFTVLVYEEVVR